MFFASDNAGPVAPAIMDALARANDGYALPYGQDALMESVRAQLREIFEAPDAAVYLVATGTAANALILGTLADPWDAIFAHRLAHVEEDECGAPEFYTNGTKIALVDGADGKMDPAALRRAIRATGDKGVHGVQRGPVSLTQASEVGSVYSLDEIAALTGIAREFGLPTHLDGARFANALATLGCTPAQMTWRAGVDAVSFGGTKNGCMGVEAVLFFDPARAWEFELRRKRGAHLFSKHRFLSAQMAAYLADDLWLDLARAANASAARLAEGLRALDHCRLLHPVQANMIFAELPRAAHRRAMQAGARYYLSPFDTPLDGPDDTPVQCRLVCDWSQEDSRIDAFLRAVG
ncbi:threonine aldolase family protein [Brevirhabdus sp.]|uniref:threonine aldolase family protein n=1 Tax=Brevirhabdus sp. TaxID=2004514 RepID=UPI004059E21D